MKAGEDRATPVYAQLKTLDIRSRKMYTFVYYICGGSSLKAEDVDFELETLSDVILRILERDEHYPAYTESRIAQREAVDAQRAEQLSPLHHNPQRDAVALLRREEVELMLREASLTPRQLRVINLFMQGYNFEEIGRKTGVSKQAAHKLFLRACEAIRRSWNQHPLHGMAIAYSESTLRRYARRVRWLNRDEQSD